MLRRAAAIMTIAAIGPVRSGTGFCENPGMNRPSALVHLLEQRIEYLHALAPDVAQTCRNDPRVQNLLLASDYAAEQLRIAPELVQGLALPGAGLSLSPEAEAEWPKRLRRYRHAESVRLIYRDVNGIDTLEDTLHGTSRLAERCLAGALDAANTALEARHGTARSITGMAQRMVVFGLGKLGGGELNFSSDIDLVFAFAEAGQSDGARVLDNEAYFQRLGQRLIQLLADVDADGMVYRVDMRLRPFGQVGRLALSFAAMEHYFQREGRDWERYAWIKARPVAGDLAQGERFLGILRPFIYRRYLDFGAFEGLREMKTMIEAEVQRREREADLKLGRGGIREIEFIVQLQQLIRAGREPDLRVRSLIPALARLRDRGHIPDRSAEALLSAYRFLRKLENRVQMLRQEQTQQLPEDALDRARLAYGMGFADTEALLDALERHRATVADEFARVFQARGLRQRHAPAHENQQRLAALWQASENGMIEDRAAELETLGFADGTALATQLQNFRHLSALSALSARARARLDRLLPALLAAAAASSAPDAVATRGLALVQAVLRRSSYLALLDEQPAALTRLVEVIAGSRWMAERLCAHPLLLDDLLDARGDAKPPTQSEVAQGLAQVWSDVPEDDVEARLLGLNEFRQSFAFRVARASLIDHQQAGESARQLAFVAEAVVGAALPLAVAEVARQHGHLPGDGLAVVAYGSFGGQELGLGSDLDLVFLYDGAHAGQESLGARPLDALRYHTRVVQKLLGLLGMPTPAGRLYEADLRLRPDGAKGLLVSSMESFSTYQRERAWTWEQQALVRARVVAGHAALAETFARVRAEVLGAPRQADAVRADVVSMRQRMRAELDRSHAGSFDLKQGEGGLVDLEFLLQGGVLLCAHAQPEVMRSTRTPDLIAALHAAGWLNAGHARSLHQAYTLLLARALACTLDGRPRMAAHDAELDAARAAVIAAWHALLPVPPGPSDEGTR